MVKNISSATIGQNGKTTSHTSFVTVLGGRDHHTLGAGTLKDNDDNKHAVNGIGFHFMLDKDGKRLSLKDIKECSDKCEKINAMEDHCPILGKCHFVRSELSRKNNGIESELQRKSLDSDIREYEKKNDTKLKLICSYTGEHANNCKKWMKCEVFEDSRGNSVLRKFRYQPTRA